MSYPNRSNDPSRKPRCFGDVDEHSARDRTCQDCRWFQTCAVIVKNKKRDDEDDRGRRYSRDDRDDRDDRDRNSRKSSGPGRTMPVSPDPADFVERDDESFGFFGALAFNGFLSGMRAGAMEGIFAMDQIPRAPYPDPFRDFWKKPKPPEEEPRRSRRYRDEDEDDKE